MNGKLNTLILALALVILMPAAFSQTALAAEKFTSNTAAYSAYGLLAPAQPVGETAFTGHWKRVKPAEEHPQCLTLYEDSSWSLGYDKDVASDVPSLGIYTVTDGVAALYSFSNTQEREKPAELGEKRSTIIREGDRLIETRLSDNEIWEYEQEEKPLQDIR